MTWQNILKQKINWLDAFDKYGFNDGQDNRGHTDSIVDFLYDEGYTPMVVGGGHNVYISQIKKDDDIVLERNQSHDRSDFPAELAKLLDDKFGKAVKVTYDF